VPLTAILLASRRSPTRVGITELISYRASALRATRKRRRASMNAPTVYLRARVCSCRHALQCTMHRSELQAHVQQRTQPPANAFSQAANVDVASIYYLCEPEGSNFLRRELTLHLPARQRALGCESEWQHRDVHAFDHHKKEAWLEERALGMRNYVWVAN